MPLHGIAGKSELRLLGVTVDEDLCNWDRLYIPRVYKYYGYSLQELHCCSTALPYAKGFASGLYVMASYTRNINP